MQVAGLEARIRKQKSRESMRYWSQATGERNQNVSLEVGLIIHGPNVYLCLGPFMGSAYIYVLGPLVGPTCIHVLGPSWAQHIFMSWAH